MIVYLILVLFFVYLRSYRKSSAGMENGANKMATAVSKQTNNAGTNCVPVERPQENAERRSYYQELAGIDHQCTNHERDTGAQQHNDPETELPLGASASSPNQVSHRHLKSSPHHRRAKTCDPQVHGLKKQTLQMNQELFAKYEYAQRHHKDYHMQLLEASRTRLEGMQPAGPMQAVTAGAEATFCHHSPKQHSFPAEPAVQVVTTQVVAPAATQAAPVSRGKHRRRSRRHHTLQPLTVMKHEVMEKTEGVGCSPVTQKHQHHHHHEHHHHHHYHHYHDID